MASDHWNRRPLDANPYLKQACHIVNTCIRIEIFELAKRITVVVGHRRRKQLMHPCPLHASMLINACDWSRVIERTGETAPTAYFPYLSALAQVVDALERGAFVGVGVSL